jgi:hypothetical protein
MRLTATAIKYWFQYRCERQFVYTTMSPEDRRNIPILARPVPAWAIEGDRFERRVLEAVEREAPGQVLTPRPGDRALSGAASLAFLKRRTPETWAYQLLLEPTPALRRLMWPDGNSPPIDLGRGHVDLVHATTGPDGRPLFRIYDVKATRQPRAFHRIQVAWYALLLRGVLAQNGIPGGPDSEGVIWTTGRAGSPVGEDQGSCFPLRPYESVLRDWARRRLPRLAEYRVDKGYDSTPFHIYFKCEQCSYLPHCEQRIADTLPPPDLDPSAIPGLTQRSKRALVAAGAASLGRVPAVLERVAADPASGWRMRTRRARLAGRAEALLEQAVRPAPDRVTLRMPPRSDVAIYLVADHDPIEARLATVGAMIARARKVVGSEVQVVSSAGEEPDALRTVLGAVAQAVQDCDRRNARGAREVLHIFVYEPSEAADLAAALGRCASAPGLLGSLVEMVRLFPPEDLVPEPAYRGFHHLPGGALRSVLEEAFEIPAKVSYDLARVSRALAAARAPLAGGYRPGPDFARPFSSRLSIEQCIALARGEADREAVRMDVRSRLQAMRSLAEWIEDRDRELSPPERFLRLMKAPFRLQREVNPMSRESLELLRAHELLGQHAGFLQGMNSLAEPVERRRERLVAIDHLHLLRQGDRGQWLLFGLPAGADASDLGPGGLGLVLTDGHPDRLLDPAGWSSFRVRWQPPRGPQDRGQALLTPVGSRGASPGLRALLDRSRGAPWVLDRVPTDLNGARSMAFLQALGAP